ncbi:MAG: hypothetical protein OEY20_00165 [Gemmatimonadota bacterium]|nr:hypothetical protein [Gemmatimonadota bacterium]MDH4349758.1 hypothetical protein [Gemmatimonadota bacterium]MDH5195648.1 hypothetical protein [Gemmatimonadota bacterium]
MASGPADRPEIVVRSTFAVATVVFGLLGFVTREGRFFVAAGVVGIVWTLWDVVWGRMIEPASAWVFRMLTEGAGGAPPNIRPTLDDTIRLLESHLESGASQRVKVQAAIRLEEIYRTVRKDPSRARAVVRRVRELCPEAPELQDLGWTDDQ